MQRQGGKIRFFSRRRRIQRLPEADESPHCVGKMRVALAISLGNATQCF